VTERHAIRDDEGGAAPGCARRRIARDSGIPAKITQALAGGSKGAFQAETGDDAS